MKDQYFGDLNDYMKYAILREFEMAGLRLALHWMWTPNDRSNDG